MGKKAGRRRDPYSRIGRESEPQPIPFEEPTPNVAPPAAVPTPSVLPGDSEPAAGFPIFDLGFDVAWAEQVLDGAELADNCVKDLQDWIRGYLRRCLSQPQLTAARCKNCIKDAVDGAIQFANRAGCDLDQTLQQRILTLTGMAQEIAAGIGCGPAPPPPPPPPPPMPQPRDWPPPEPRPGPEPRDGLIGPPIRPPGIRLPPPPPPGREPGLSDPGVCGWQVACLYSPQLNGGMGGWHCHTVFLDGAGDVWGPVGLCDIYDCTPLGGRRIRQAPGMGVDRFGRRVPIGSAECPPPGPEPPPPPPPPGPGPAPEPEPCPPCEPGPKPPLPPCPPAGEDTPGPDVISALCKSVGAALDWGSLSICDTLAGLSATSMEPWGARLAEWLCGSVDIGGPRPGIECYDPAAGAGGMPPIGDGREIGPPARRPGPKPESISDGRLIGPPAKKIGAPSLILPGSAAFAMPERIIQPPAGIRTAPTGFIPGVGGGLIGDTLVDAIGQLLCVPVEWIGKALDWFSGLPKSCGTCADPTVWALHLLRGLVGLAEKWIGDNFNEIQQPFTYWSGYLCPHLIPSAADANAAWLSADIDDDLWRCWTRANGMHDAPWAKIRRAMRSKLSPGELTALWLREEITEEMHDKRIRELGYTEAFDALEFRALSNYIPPVQDLLRFMVRDVEDARIVQRFGMDDDFALKWAGSSKRWGRWQGIADEVAQRYWRAHWTIPSPTQLYEFLRRERHNPKWGGAAAVESDVRTALIQQDVLPFWVDRLMGLAYNPLTRVDAKRAYSISVIDRTELEKAYQAIGYDDANAKVLADFTDKTGRQAARKNRWAKLYQAGGVNEAEARQQLEFDGVRKDWIDEIVVAVSWEVTAKRKLECVKSFKKRYMRGELDDTAAVNEILGQNLDNNWAQETVKGWACERAARGKWASMSQACRWLEIGLIDGPEFLRRAGNVGFEPAEAARLLADCSDRISTKQAKENERRAKEAEREARRQAAESAAAGRKFKQAAERAAKAAAAAAKARERRDDQLLEAAEVYAKTRSIKLPEAVREVKAAAAYLRANTTDDLDDVVQHVVLAVEAAPKTGPYDLSNAALQRSVAEVTLSGSIAEAGGSSGPSTNGSIQPP